MDSVIMELRIKQWMPIFEAQAKSGMNKQEWCRQNEISRFSFFKWQREVRKYLLEKNGNKFHEQLSAELAVHKLPDFVELSPANSSVRSSLNGCCIESGDITPASTISIRCGAFSIDLDNDVNELLLSKVLKVMANVN